MMADSLAEDRHSPVPGLVHRYPDRVLMLITTQCASYCRYCTRSRIVGDPTQNFNRRDHEAQLGAPADDPVCASRVTKLQSRNACTSMLTQAIVFNPVSRCKVVVCGEATSLCSQNLRRSKGFTVGCYALKGVGHLLRDDDRRKCVRYDGRP